MTIFYFGRKGIEQTGFSGFRSRFIPTFAPLTPERLRRPYNPAQALSSVRNWCSEQKRLERGFVYGGTGIARLRSLCNASYVRPKNRAKARFLLDGLCKFSARKTWGGGRSVNGCKSSFTAALLV